MGNLLTFMGGLLIHQAIKNKAVKKAEAKAKAEHSVGDHFYISAPAERDWIDLQSGFNNQPFRVLIMKIEHYIKNFGGSDIKTLDSTVDTKIYFQMPRSSVQPMFDQLKREFGHITLGEVKSRNYQ